MTRLFHISDLHIHGEKKKNEAVEANLERLKQEVSKHDYDGYVIIATGDILDDGSPEQYKEAQRLLDPFVGHMVLVPGNHDVGWLGNFWDVDASKRFNALAAQLSGEGDARHYCVSYSFSQYRIYVLDSTRRITRKLSFARGKIGWSQLRKVKRFLADCQAKKGVTSVVCLHHDPFDREWPMALIDADKVLKTVTGRTHYLLCGHSHKEQSWHFGPDEAHSTHFHSARQFYADKIEIAPLE